MNHEWWEKTGQVVVKSMSDGERQLQIIALLDDAWILGWRAYRDGRSDLENPFRRREAKP